MTLITSVSAQTIKQELVSPVTTDASKVFWSGTATTLFLVLTQDQISDKVTHDLSTHKPLGDASKVGDYYGQMIPNAAYTLGMLAHGYFAKNETSTDRAEMMFKASAYAGLTATLIKYTVREPRPDNIKEKNSFPSGHTTTAFAFASMVAMEHEWYWGAPALALATLTGVSRMNDGRHFLHDVVAGMTIGASYGLGVWYAKRGQGAQVAFAPIIDENTTGLRMVGSF
jgi:hypothetical protein